MNIIILANTSWNLLNFRKNLIKSFLDHGHQVYIIAPYDSSIDEINKMGCKSISIRFDSKSKNPIKDFILLVKYINIFRVLKPDLILGFTIKPNIYGSLAARFQSIPVINNITGLGSVFINQSFSTRVVQILYKFALHKSSMIFFQNNHDLNLFKKRNIIHNQSYHVLPGSGVNIEYFKQTKKNIETKHTFLFIGRLLYEKGVNEYINAAKILKKCYPDLVFSIIGEIDSNNPSAIPKEAVVLWEKKGIITYLGLKKDIRQEIEAASCIVLPSYREGTSRALLEAAAMSKPLIASDVPGCNNIVSHGYNGFLCKVKNHNDLVSKMKLYLDLSNKEKRKFGENSRQKAVDEFDEKIVISAYHSEISKIIKENDLDVE